jgi:glycosyltransferase involved in cell wall biosynthesis
MQYFFLFVAIGILIYWLRFCWFALAFARLLQKFSVVKPVQGPLPKVSVVVPAKNEGKNVEACLRGLQQQTYSNLEIILVNDRSTDDTGAVMERYASMFPNWHYIEIKELPDGWLGKNHALHKGGIKATGDYIVFTDGDVIYHPSTIEKTIQSVLTHKLDHLVLSATLKGDGPMLIAMQALFTLGMVGMLKLHKLGTSPNYYIGAGVYNLVKTSIYRSLGGHESIRLEVIDDLMLGKIMVQAGAKPGFMDGRDLISVEWYPNAWEMIKGLEKNGFASVRYSLLRLVGFMAVTYGIYLLPYIGIFIFPMPIKLLFGLSLFFSHAAMGEISRRTGHSFLITLLLPIAAIYIGFAFFRSAALTLIRGRVTWRDTSYSLKLLKQSTKL